MKASAQRERAIRAALSVYDNPDFVYWANTFLNNKYTSIATRRAAKRAVANSISQSAKVFSSANAAAYCAANAASNALRAAYASTTASAASAAADTIICAKRATILLRAQTTQTC